jgi:hypothetical protein
LPSDFGVQRGQFTFEGDDLQDYRRAVGGRFTGRVAEFFAGRPFRDGIVRRRQGENETTFGLGDDLPSGEDRLGPDRAASGKAQMVEALVHRRPGIALPLLVGIKGASDVFKLAEHLRNLV